MASSAWRWDDGPPEAEDPAIGRSAASLTRVPIRSSERSCNRRKAGDLTFDPTKAHGDSAPDLFVKRQRADESLPKGEVEHTGHADAPAGPATGQTPDSVNGNAADPYDEDVRSLLGSGGRAALTRAKPATRRRNPLSELNGVQSANGIDPDAPDNRRPDASAAVIDINAAPKATDTEAKSGWRSAFSRWRKRVILGAAASAHGSDRTRAEETEPAVERRPSQNTNLYDYWTQLRRGRALPAWADIRMDEVANAWPNSFLVSFEPTTNGPNGASPVVRARRITPEGATGQDADAIPLTDTVIEWILATARAAVKHGEPVQDRESFRMHDASSYYGIVAVPFSGDGSGIEHILCHLKQLPNADAARRRG